MHCLNINLPHVAYTIWILIHAMWHTVAEYQFIACGIDWLNTYLPHVAYTR